MRKFPSPLVAVLAILMLILAACSDNGGGASASAAASEAANGSAGPSAMQRRPPEAPEAAEPGSSELQVGVVTDVGHARRQELQRVQLGGRARSGPPSVGAPEPRCRVTTESSEYEGNIQAFVDQGSTSSSPPASRSASDHACRPGQPRHLVHRRGPGPPSTTRPPDRRSPARVTRRRSCRTTSRLSSTRHRPGYLAGIVAASVSETGEIGAIGGFDTIPPVIRYMRGYENGAHSRQPGHQRD